MAAAVARRDGGRKRGSGGKGPKIILALLGFVLLAVGVNMRRMYGFRQATNLRAMQQQREALVSEQLKLQDAIRIASDRKHIMEIAQSRLGMKLPELTQVIDLPHRPLAPGKDSLRP
jgi:cell division protein FtsL